MDKNLELRRLYTQSFDDSEAFVDYFFRKLTSPDKVVALIRDGKTVSALHLLDRRIFLRGELFEMPFVVAAATVRELRGMRLLETVMRTAFERLYNVRRALSFQSCVLSQIRFRDLYENIEERNKIQKGRRNGDYALHAFEYAENLQSLLRGQARLHRETGGHL